MVAVGLSSNKAHRARRPCTALSHSLLLQAATLSQTTATTAASHRHVVATPRHMTLLATSIDRPGRHPPLGGCTPGTMLLLL